MRFFFYGTLLDRDVMALVLGRRLPPAAYTPAILLGHARRRAKGASYPTLVRDAATHVAGAVVGGLSARDVARLSAYEGPKYQIVPLRVVLAGGTRTVSVFEPVESRLAPSQHPWSLVLWQQRDKRAFVDRLRRAFSVRPAYSTP
ncbi:MAG: gamma-glutamylcyclotransferase family protein [Reyranella sp.]|uniref:gamma-glutamylcyclotransferase family protein n=1 Tax=Reyranella sp. TaxID=1929291 RepID=UPI003D0C8B2E